MVDSPSSAHDKFNIARQDGTIKGSLSCAIDEHYAIVCGSLYYALLKNYRSVPCFTAI